MTPADLAREAAISFECKKDALTQRQSGDWKISFTVQDTDMDPRITSARMGTRFVAVLVEVNDDELPVSPPVEKEKIATPRPTHIPKSPAGAKRAFRDLPPAQQAGIHCEDPMFAAFLREARPDDWHEAQDAAECVRLICAVSTRADLSTNHKARVIWRQVDSQFQAWKAMEHA